MKKHFKPELMTYRARKKLKTRIIKKKRLLYKEKLFIFGSVTQNDLDFFIKKFVLSKKPYYQYSFDNIYGWYKVINRNTKDEIELAGGTIYNHLLHRNNKVLGTCNKRLISNVLICDIDVNLPRKTKKKDLYKKIKNQTELRIKKLQNILGQPTFIFQSSESGGLHLYWFSKKSFSVNSIFKKLKSLMPESIMPGSIELFPKTNCTLRLPLGKGSRLLHPQKIRPLFLFNNKLQEIIETIKYLPKAYKETDIIKKIQIACRKAKNIFRKQDKSKCRIKKIKTTEKRKVVSVKYATKLINNIITKGLIVEVQDTSPKVN
ncbi:MAG TPA: hypothetical protein DC057_17315 [Spirochaetia bacterium]|nr:hypothetical protein [Spirochaetia bacterium]